MRRSFRGRRQGRHAHVNGDPGDSTPQDAQQNSWDQEAPLADEAGLADDDSGLDREFQPFVPVEAGGYRQYGKDDETSEDASTGHERRRWLSRLRLPHLRLPRPRLPRAGMPGLGVEVRGGVLLLVVVLIAAGIFGTLLGQGTVRGGVEGWWPLVILAGALLWMLLALVRRRVAPFLGAWVLVGVGLSALLDTQSIALVQDTVLGVVLVSVGLGIAFRGFLLRQQAIP